MGKQQVENLKKWLKVGVLKPWPRDHAIWLSVAFIGLKTW